MDAGMNWSWLWWGIPAGIAGVFLLIFIARRYVKVGPNEVLIVSGLKHRVRDEAGLKSTVGYRIVRGGGTFVLPIFERVDRLSLELFTLDVNTPEVYTRLGVPVFVDGIAQVKVRSDDAAIRTAAEQFLSKGRTEIMRIAMQTLEGHLRAIIGALTVEEAYSNREMFAARVQEVAGSDMAGMGLTIVSFTTRDIKDKQGYLEALGRPQIAEVKKNAEVSEANARRDTLILSAKAEQEGRTAQLAADTEIAEADRDYKMRVAEYEAAIQQKKAIADLAYDLEKNKLNQQVRAEELQVELVDKSKRIEIEAKEIERREKELVASVEKPAAAERFRIETLAEAEKTRLEKTAFGEAEATRRRGEADADAEKARGLARAEIIRQQGNAEAGTMDKKAAAWKQYNEAAIVQMLAEKLPEIARAVSEPLAKTEKMIIINSDGASRVTQDITKVIAQLPPVVESLTGLDFAKLLQRIPRLAGTTEDKSAPAKDMTESPVIDRGKITLPRPAEEKSARDSPA
jgi:flotillin